MAQPRKEWISHLRRTHTASTVTTEDTATQQHKASKPCGLKIANLNFFYGAKASRLRAQPEDSHEQRVTALIGPSGCGKSTFLRTLNRMNETIRNTRVRGQILLDGQDILQHGRREASAAASAWSSSAPTRSRNRSMTMSPTACASTASKAGSTIWWSKACAAPRCGTK